MLSVKSLETGFYNPLIQDYLKGSLRERGVVDWDYSEMQIFENAKERRFTSEDRKILVEVLKEQLGALSPEEQRSLTFLEQPQTFTITTGHQLILLGGPQYFYTKILDVINWCKKLTEKSEFDFVPVFWLASEDHDFEEISKTTLFGKTIVCPGENKGPVGRIEGAYFEGFLQEVLEILGEGEQVQKVREILNYAFRGENLTEITRRLVRSLFAHEGLLVIDGDDPALKTRVAPYFEKELLELITIKSVEQQLALMDGYKVQVTPRPINLFYITDDTRVRIEKTEIGYQTIDGVKVWTSNEILFELKSNPENFSPNALLRPFYQEVVLPNVAYVGGAGEIAYWLELPQVFKAFDIDFPLPIVRNSYFTIPEKSWNWWQEQGFNFLDFFEDRHVLTQQILAEIGSDEIDFTQEEQELTRFYKALLDKSIAIDPQLEKVVLGEEKRALSALQNVQKRFQSAEKRKHELVLQKLGNTVDKCFPNGIAMERVGSFFPLLIQQENPSTLFNGEAFLGMEVFLVVV